jgi:hypothetical protein
MRYTHTHAHTRTDTHKDTHAHTHAHTHTHAQTNKHTRTDTQTHTYTHNRTLPAPPTRSRDWPPGRPGVSSSKPCHCTCDSSLGLLEEVSTEDSLSLTVAKPTPGTEGTAVGTADVADDAADLPALEPPASSSERRKELRTTARGEPHILVAALLEPAEDCTDCPLTADDDEEDDDEEEDDDDDDG